MAESAEHQQVSDDEIAAHAPNGTVRGAVTCLSLAGFTTLLTGVQMVTSVRFRDAALQLSLYAMIALGLLTMYVGIRLFRMREWAARAGVALGAVLTLGMGAFTVYSLGSGLFSCITLFTAPLALVAAILSGFSIAPAARATQVRQRLQDDGIDLGL